MGEAGEPQTGQLLPLTQNARAIGPDHWLDFLFRCQTTAHDRHVSVPTPHYVPVSGPLLYKELSSALSYLRLPRALESRLGDAIIHANSYKGNSQPCTSSPAALPVHDFMVLPGQVEKEMTEGGHFP
jgi:hypothetical protein